MQHKNFAFDCREAAFYLMFTLATVLAQDLLMQVADALDGSDGDGLSYV